MVIHNLVPSWAVPILAAIWPIFGTVLGTVISIVAARYLWNWWRRPILEITDTSTRTVYDYNTDRWDNAPTAHQILLTNEGKFAAENCKPVLTLQGESDTHEYRISTPVCWSEGDYPTRQTINRKETIGFDFFRVATRGIDEYVRFPSENGWPDYSQLIVEPLPSFAENADGIVTSVERSDTELEEISDVEWKISTVKVTAQNASSAEAEIDITIADKELTLNVE